MSNGIGDFVVGLSPVGGSGALVPFDYFSTVISQYANSPILLQLIENYNQYLDQTVDMDAFYQYIWNVDTAEGYGLDVWGRIVGISRTIAVAPTGYFDFEESGLSGTPFGIAVFFSGIGVTTNVELSDEAYRLLIFVKALSNISDGSIPSLNQLLLNLFPGRGNCYVVDNEDMSIIYTFEFDLTPVELAVVSASLVLLAPTGVSVTIGVPAIPGSPFSQRDWFNPRQRPAAQTSKI